MSYVDAIHSRDEDRIYVVERDTNGKRQYKEYPANYTFYYPDAKGKFRSLYGTPVSRFSTRKRSEFEKERRIHSGKELFESDVLQFCSHSRRMQVRDIYSSVNGFLRS